MSLEPGGRSDKYGNKYENGYLAKLLLRLVNEKLTSVTVEPLGPNSDSVEFYTTQKDNTIKYYQCKASNSTHKSWSVSDLKRFDVFQRAKRIILSAENSYYYFISPLQYDELDELCKRARTNSSPEEFVSYQLTNVPIRNLFNDCATQFGLDKNDPDELRQLVFILAHCYFEQYASGTEAEQDLEEHIGLFFTGKAATARVLLEQYANDTGNYGVKITAKDIIDYLEKQDIYIRNYGQDERVLNRITELNKIHWDTYHAIFDSLIHRQATDEIIAQIESGYSTILHGKAGCGKSGCLQELIDYLDKNHLLYLALKLDKHLPTCSADNYGKKLGLPESPIHCLATIAAGKNCVLILDQLDALRWTSCHSGEALSVCKELISQAEAINKYWGGKVSIVFASRTFDLENDKGLKSLFETKEKSTGLNWSKINVDFFAETDVLQIIGPSYNCLSSRLKKLLLTPSSLYVWSKLEDRNKTNSIYSVFELMNVWWNQIQQKCEMANIVLSDIIGCKNRIVNAMEKRSVFVLPSSLFIDFSKENEYTVTSSLDSEHKLAHSLLDNSINCARGCALNTISSLIWEHKELGEFFKEIVISASTDEYDAVRFAVMSCVIPYYNIDRKFSFGIFQTLVSRDLRIIYAPGCWEILSREYHNHTDFIREKIVEACLSDIEDLSECASGFLCAIAIFHNDDVAFSFLTSHDFSNKQHRKICQQATYSFNMDEYHEKSEKILLHLMNTATEELPGFSRLFFDRCILIHRDRDFLIHLLESQQNIHLLHTFLDYLYESDEDICEYAPVIKALGNGLAETRSEWNSRLVINDLVKCVVRLFDRGQDDPHIKTICLDVWDKLFMSNLQDIKPLSDMIDNFE